jgi:ketopantoate reductase
MGDVPAPVVDAIRSEIFIKAVNSMAFNAVAVLSGATNGQIADCAPSVDALRSIMGELEQLSDAFELPLGQTADERICQTLASRAHTMSMLHDLKQGNDLEAGLLFDSFAAMAELVGVSLPLTAALVQVMELRKSVVDQELAAAEPMPEPRGSAWGSLSAPPARQVSMAGVAKM